jgi:hypothetical protein
MCFHPRLYFIYLLYIIGINLGVSSISNFQKKNINKKPIKLRLELNSLRHQRRLKEAVHKDCCYWLLKLLLVVLEEEESSNFQGPRPCFY